MRHGAALASLALLAACQVGESLHAPEGGLQRMIEQPRYDAFEASAFFADGMTMRVPPEGTQPFGARPPAPVATGLDDEGRPLEDLPLPITASLLARGRRSYDIVCATCHGVTGTSETFVARSMRLRPPPSLVDGEPRDYPPGRVYRVISAGFGLMPSFADHLDVEERWAVVAYLEALQLSRRVHVDELPPRVRVRLEEEAP